jgi:hypothetical protein
MAKNDVMTHEEAARDRARRIAEGRERLPRTCTKYELVNALKALDPALLERVRAAYASDADLQFFWNTVQELSRDNEDFARLAASLGATGEQLDALFAKVKEAR